MKNHYQLPLRMPAKLAGELHEASEATGIQMSRLCRMGISRLLVDLKGTGRTVSMKEFSNHYREIS